MRPVRYKIMLINLGHIFLNVLRVETVFNIFFLGKNAKLTL